MLGSILGIGSSLEALLGLCASVVLLVYLGLLVAPTVRRWFEKDAVLTAMEIQHRTNQPVARSLDDELQDSLYETTEGLSIEDLEQPEMFVPGVEALTPRHRPTRSLPS